MSESDFFVLLKPDARRRFLVGEILSRFEKRGFILKRMKTLVPSVELVRQHYEEFRDASFYNDLITFTSSDLCIAIVFRGNLEVAIKMVGDKVPWMSERGSIRGDLTCTMPQNLIHCSCSYDAAKREIELWFGST